MNRNILTTIVKVSHEMNKESIRWAVGASMMLKLRGIDIEVHDIDLMVHEDDFELAHSCLLSFCEEIRVESSNLFKTRYFKRYSYMNTEIDLMSGMGIMHKTGLFNDRFETFEISVRYENVEIPLCYIEDWFVFYHLMPERTKTINRIDLYFSTHPINKARIIRILELNLPDSLRSELLALIDK